MLRRKRIVLMEQFDLKAVLADGMRYAFGVGAVAYLLIYIGVALARMAYPFGLEWMEGGSLIQMHRILEGKRLYVPPSVEFVPYIYPPLYFYCAAFLSRLTGLEFMALRAVSFFASLGCFAIIFLIVTRETHNRFSGLAASGLFAATFEISGAWFDIARVDSLFLFFTLLGVYWARRSEVIRENILAGFSFFLASMTKQQAILIAVCCMIYGFRRHIRQRCWLLGTFLILTGGTFLIMDAIHEGWYHYYLFEIPRRHALIPKMLLIFWGQDMIRPLAIALGGGLWFVGEPNHGQQDAKRFWIAVGIGMIGSSWLSRMHTGGYINVLFPAYAVVSIMFGLGMERIMQSMRQAKLSPFFLRTFLYGIGCLQLFSLLYNPLEYIPPKQYFEAGREFLERLKMVSGDVYIPRHGYLALLAGKQSFAQEMAVFDLERGGQVAKQDQIPRQLRREIDAAIAKQQFAAIITDYETTVFAPYYEPQRPDFQEKNAFSPVTGIETRPKWWYIPR